MIVNAALCPAERAASVVRLQAAELVRWRFRNGCHGPKLRRNPRQGQGDAKDQQ